MPGLRAQTRSPVSAFDRHRNRMSHASHGSWVSDLAAANVSPIPYQQSLAHSHSLNHLSNATVKPDKDQDVTPRPPIDYLGFKFGGEKEDDDFERLELPTAEEAAIMAKEMVIVETSPTNTTPSRKSRARSIVGGFVHSLRNIPKAMTSNHQNDRSYTPSTTSRSHTREAVRPDQVRILPMPAIVPGLAYSPPGHHHGQHRQAQPIHGLPGYPVPVILSPPYGAPPPFYQPKPPTQIDTTVTDSKRSYSDGSLSSRLGGFFEELSNLPWISSRVAVDYMPGERDRGRGTRLRSKGSWYTVDHPATPSDLSQNVKYLPTPWFSPQRPSTAIPPTVIEVPEEEGEPSQSQVQGRDTSAGAGTESQGGAVAAERKLERAQEDIQAKESEMLNLNRIIDYQKAHIGELEHRIQRLQEEADVEVDVHMRRRSTRRSLQLKTRNSVRTVTSVQTRSISRPVSTMQDRGAVL